MKHDALAILDYGSQYTHLISNRLRRLGVFTEILLPDAPASALKPYKGIILSGGPQSVYDKGALSVDPAIFSLGVPVLGICYGHQLMQHLLGGTVAPGKTKEYGAATLTIKNPLGIFSGLAAASQVWMSHGDTVTALGAGFKEVAGTADLPFSAVADVKRDFYGLQFHPEVTHSTEGMKLLEAFVERCRMKRDWTMEAFLKEQMEALKSKVGDRNVFLFVSGGVDSTVAFALLEKSLGDGRVHGYLVDTGFMRKDEAARVQKSLAAAGFKNLHVARKQKLFYEKLRGVTEPEAKRKIIGELFWQVKEEIAETEKLEPDHWVVAQGTIYPDTIETGGTRHADRIKTHHNRVDLMQELIRQGKVVEPLAELYKDEVRELGLALGLPHELVFRKPFPGPGLAVRILCASEAEVSQAPDFEDLDARINAFLNERWPGVGQARVLPVKSVGVQGDNRTYRHPVALFTQERDWARLSPLSTALTNRFPEVNRVMLALAGGSEAALNLKATDLSEKRVVLLQTLDDRAAEIVKKYPHDDEAIWQFPVVLLPLGSAAAHESVVLRPIHSTEAMTASFAMIGQELLKELTEAMRDPAVSHVFYDITNKPPATIEWE